MKCKHCGASFYNCKTQTEKDALERNCPVIIDHLEKKEGVKE